MKTDTTKTDFADGGSPKVLRAFRHPRMLIAAVIAVILLAFAASAADRLASEIALSDQLQEIQTQITLYKLHHSGIAPYIQDNELPQLTASTNLQGHIGPSGPEYTHGPYFSVELPRNPIDGSNRITAVAEPGKQPTSAVGNLGGWQYDETTGMIYPNNPEYFHEQGGE